MRFKKQEWETIHDRESMCRACDIAVVFMQNPQSKINNPMWWIIEREDYSVILGGPCDSRTEAIQLAEELIATGMI